MSYASIVDMAGNQTLRNRITACAAQENVPEPEGFVGLNIWKLVSTTGWSEDWDTAKSTYNNNQNPDFGARTDIISDAEILAAVQALAPPALLMEETPPA